MVPGLHNLITRIPPVTPAPAPYAAVYNLNWLSASGTACLLATLATAIVLRVRPAGSSKTYVATFKQLKMAMLTIACMLGLAYLMNYSGMTSTLGLALAGTGVSFPFFSAVLGWLGVFLTGSDTSANALFGNLQVVTANALGLNPILTAIGELRRRRHGQDDLGAEHRRGRRRHRDDVCRREPAVPLHHQAQRAADDRDGRDLDAALPTSSPARFQRRRRGERKRGPGVRAGAGSREPEPGRS